MQATSFYTSSNPPYTAHTEPVRQPSTTKAAMKIAIGIIVCLGLLFLPQELVAMCVMAACATIALARVITLIMGPHASPSNKPVSGSPGSDTEAPAYPTPKGFGRSPDYDVTDGCNDCCNCCDASAGCLNDTNNDCCPAPTHVSNDRVEMNCCEIDCCQPCTDCVEDCTRSVTSCANACVFGGVVFAISTLAMTLLTMLATQNLIAGIGSNELLK